MGREAGKPSLVIKVEQVRELADFLYIGSHRGGLRVALFHPAEDMNENAANALLKGLEEPPAAAVFILVSGRPAQLLPTIRSRCVALPVPLPPREAALEWLVQQGIKAPERWLAYAGGAPLRALEHAAQGPVTLNPVGEREALEPLADALQKIALDRALMAFSLPAKYKPRPATFPGNKPGPGSHSHARWARRAAMPASAQPKAILGGDAGSHASFNIIHIVLARFASCGCAPWS